MELPCLCIRVTQSDYLKVVQDKQEVHMHRYLALVAAAIGGLVTWKHVRTRSAENAMWDQVTHTVKKHS
ncbi:DLW-39 family protein [Dermatophilus congolensis]|uniref:Uncharacterized protein n=1 Tax=Dermatophilus congolensis TaxID=1863 RepID=A0A239V8S7_9MICO|nr:Uncharacterised protein [Dermatophilus congolensis]